MEVLVWVGFSQSLFSGFIMAFVKKDQSTSNRLLTAWFFISALEFLRVGIDSPGAGIHLSNPFLIFNPLIYFYSKSLIKPGIKLKLYQLIHVLPYLLLTIGAYVLDIRFRNIHFFSIDSSTWFKIVFGITSVISFVGYSIPSLINIHRYRINLKNEYSTLDRQITLGWLLFVIIYYMIFMITAYTLGIIHVITHEYMYSILVTFSLLMTLIYIFSFYGLLQERIYPLVSVEEELKPENYKNPRLEEEEKQKIKKELESYFVKNKPYFDSRLTITMVSQKLGMPRHKLTEVLNTEIGKNFYRFVNEYRVEEIKSMLSNPAYNHYSIEAIGYECGFNSKSAFFSVFKNLTGMTPAQYKRKLEG